MIKKEERYYTGKLEDTLFNSLVSELYNTPLASSQQLDEMYKKTPGLVDHGRFTDLAVPSEVNFYSVYNSKLNKIFQQAFNTHHEVPYSIHTIKYSPKGYASIHRDDNSIDTFVLMLEDQFTGGDLVVQGQVVDFYKKGEYVWYRGIDTPHYTIPVETGFRKILTLFYGISNNDKISKSAI